jgi:hypothetical protein
VARFSDPEGVSSTPEHDTGDENDWTWKFGVVGCWVLYHPSVLGLRWVIEYEDGFGFDDVAHRWVLRRIADGSLATDEEREMVRGRMLPLLT